MLSTAHTWPGQAALGVWIRGPVTSQWGGLGGCRVGRRPAFCVIPGLAAWNWPPPQVSKEECYELENTSSSFSVWVNALLICTWVRSLHPSTVLSLFDAMKCSHKTVTMMALIFCSYIAKWVSLLRTTCYSWDLGSFENNLEFGVAGGWARVACTMGPTPSMSFLDAPFQYFPPYFCCSLLLPIENLIHRACA